jgi:Flp pilus assembly protein TadD
MLTSRISQAGPLLALAVRLVPDNGHFHNTLGAWHMQEGRGEHARQALETACRLCPENPEPLLNLGVLYEAAGQPRQAEEHFRRALELAPECEKARRALERLTEPVTLPC